MPDAIDALIKEVTVDAYDEGEQLEAFRQAFEDSDGLPFAAQVVGMDVEVVEVEFDGNVLRGLVARCRRGGQQHTVALLDVTPSTEVEPAVAELLAAHRRWAGAEPQPRRTSRRSR
jgi:hypothetical protein